VPLQDALPVLEQEFRRALEHGFTQAELDEAKANVLNSLEQAVKRALNEAGRDSHLEDIIRLALKYLTGR